MKSQRVSGSMRSVGRLRCFQRLFSRAFLSVAPGCSPLGPLDKRARDKHYIGDTTPGVFDRSCRLDMLTGYGMGLPDMLFYRSCPLDVHAWHGPPRFFVRGACHITLALVIASMSTTNIRLEAGATAAAAAASRAAQHGASSQRHCRELLDWFQ